IVLVPFRDLSDGAAATMAAALTDVVRAALAERGLEVIPFAGDGGEVGALEHARGRGARIVLGGSVRRIGARVRLAFSLTDAATGATVAGQNVDGDADDQFALEDRLVASVSAALPG